MGHLRHLGPGDGRVAHRHRGGWTDYDTDGQATLALKLVTRHGRATPLVWLSVTRTS